MKLNHLSLALVPLFALAAIPALAAGPDAAAPKKEVIVIADAADADPEVVDVADLEVGESRSLSTDSGKAVVVTRQENGWEIEVDGRKTNILMLDGRAHAGVDAAVHGVPEGAGQTRILVEKRQHGDARHTYAYVMSDAMDDAELAARIEEILKGVDGAHAVAIAGSDGKQVKVVKIRENADGTTIESGEDRQVVIVRRHAETKDDGEKPQD